MRRARSSALLLAAVLLGASGCDGGGSGPQPPTPARGAGPTATVLGASVPAQADFGDPQPATLGLKFTTSVAGTVTGVRYYRSAGNGGHHVGALWDAQGRQLASVDFPDSDATGWLQADFSTPVPISPGRTYTVSYLAPSGHYAATPEAFAGGPVVTASGPLTAIGGAYAPGTKSAFPDQTHGTAQYWVDLDFTPDPDASTYLPSPVFDAKSYWSRWSGTAAWRSGAKLPVGVWLQDPTRPAVGDGADLGGSFARVGVNTLVGLWDWPKDDHGQTAAAQAAGLAVLAGGQACAPTTVPAPGAVWPCDSADLPTAAQARQSAGDALTGYQLADEPDMNVGNGTPQGAGCMPTAKLAAFAASLHRADPSRPVHVNFGTGVALGARAGAGCEGDFAAYAAAADIVSVDYYGISTPWHSAADKGVWTYGRAAARARMLAPGKPVWVFLEVPVQMEATSQTLAGATHASPAQVRAAAWDALVNGATGLEWFCHSLAAKVDDACLRDATSAATMKQVDADAQSYAPWWNAAPVFVGVRVAEKSAPVQATLRVADGRRMLFAVGLDSASEPEGGPSDVSFVLPDHYTGPVHTSDGRTLSVVDGVFSDHLGPYQEIAYTLG